MHNSMCERVRACTWVPECFPLRVLVRVCVCVCVYVYAYAYVHAYACAPCVSPCEYCVYGDFADVCWWSLRLAVDAHVREPQAWGYIYGACMCTT